MHYQYLEHKGWTWADGYKGWLKDGQNDLDNLVRNRNLVTPEDLAWLRNLYDEEIAYTDGEIGRLIDALTHANVLERTLIVVVADHGEEFLDHGNFSHTTTLYEELVRVPMILVVPNSKEAGTVRSDVVETRSVFSTVLDCLGLDFAARSRPRGLLPSGAGRPRPRRPLLLRLAPNPPPRPRITPSRWSGSPTRSRAGARNSRSRACARRAGS